MKTGMSVIVRVAVAALCSFSAQAQTDDTGCGTVAFPFVTITMPLGAGCGFADLAQAVSHDRIVSMSNCGGMIYCKTGSERTSTLVPLEGTDLDACIFQLTPELDWELFDSRVIWDPYEERFWIVTAEKGDVTLDEPPYNNKYRGRLHIAVSAHGAPNHFGTASWTKYTYGGTREAIDLNALPNGLPSLVDAFPDRPSIMVDDTYLYVAMKEGDPGHLFNDPPEPSRFWNARSLMLVLKKSEIIAGNTHANIMETSQFIDSAGAGGTWGHELAVEQEAYVGSEHTNQATIYLTI